MTRGRKLAKEIKRRRDRDELFKNIATALGRSLPGVQNLLRRYRAYLGPILHLSGTSTSTSELRGELTLVKQSDRAAER